jgi:hypothetical protein
MLSLRRRTAIAAAENLAVIEQAMRQSDGSELDQFAEIGQSFLAGLQTGGELMVNAFL